VDILYCQPLLLILDIYPSREIHELYIEAKFATCFASFDIEMQMNIIFICNLLKLARHT